MKSNKKRDLKLRLNLSLLDELGINLYSNVPSVISEVIANAWDADSTEVVVEIRKDGGEKIVVITDNGNGMTEDDMADKFLVVGYHRREGEDGETTPKFNRAPMGRKGIGKLSLFSIANKIEIHSRCQGVQGVEEDAFILDGAAIRRQIKDGKEHECPLSRIPFVRGFPHQHGTKIILRSLTKRILMTTAKALRKRLARRFGIRCTKNMKIILKEGKNAGPITMADRDHFSKLEYIFQYGGTNVTEHCLSDITVQNYSEDRCRFNERGVPSKLGKYSICGWLGFAKKADDLKIDGESINAIPIMAREKIMHEDILAGFGFGSMFTKYAIGEIHADFLDDGPDIATSSRQKVVEDSPRFEVLSIFLGAELTRIGNIRDGENRKKGKKEAVRLIPLLEEWFDEMGSDDRQAADSFFGKINKIGGNDSTKKLLFAHAVPAFEYHRFTKNLHALTNIDEEHMAKFLKIAGHLGKLEAVYYHRITKARLAAIEKMENAVVKNKLERVVRDLLFNHLWLLHPSWAEGTEVKEKSIVGNFEKCKKADANTDAGKSRVDILFRRIAGGYVIVELKRPGRSVDSADLEKQVRKYIKEVRDHARRIAGGKHPKSVEAVCILGDIPRNWKDGEDAEVAGREALMRQGIRVLTYDQLLSDAREAHKAYLKHWPHKENKILDAVEKIMEGG